jgi:hypothetical protein
LNPKYDILNGENTTCFGLGGDLVAFVAYKRQLLVGSNPPCILKTLRVFGFLFRLELGLFELFPIILRIEQQTMLTDLEHSNTNFHHARSYKTLLITIEANEMKISGPLNYFTGHLA